MHYTTTFDNTLGLCTIRIVGNFTRPHDNAAMQQFAVDYYKQNGCSLFLFDVREANVTGGTVAVYESGAPQGEVAETLRLIQTAIVYRELGPDEDFYETVAFNRGFRLCVFDSVDKAIEWLTGNGK